MDHPASPEAPILPGYTESVTFPSALMHPTPIARPFHREDGCTRRSMTGGEFSRTKAVARRSCSSRSGRDHARRFGELATAIASLPESTLILDGEVSIFDEALISLVRVAEAWNPRCSGHATHLHGRIHHSPSRKKTPFTFRLAFLCLARRPSLLSARGVPLVPLGAVSSGREWDIGDGLAPLAMTSKAEWRAEDRRDGGTQGEAGRGPRSS